jgi:hypothetical protein
LGIPTETLIIARTSRDDLLAAPTAVIEEERTRLGEVDGAVSF